MPENVGGIYYSVDAETRGLLDAERQVDRSSRNMEKGFDRTDKSVNRLNGSLGELKGVVSAVAGALVVQRVVQYSDAWTNLQNKLRIVTDSQAELVNVTERLLQVSNQSRADIGTTADLYSRLWRSTRTLGTSQEELIQLTDTINKGFAASGATAQEAESAIRQMSQGLAAGALRGEEFNSVSEQAPVILRAVAAETGIARGELRDFAAEGGITAELLIRSVQNYSKTINREFAQTTASFGQQMTIARNNMTAFVGDLDGLQGAISGAGGAIVDVTAVLRNYTGEIDLVMGSMAGAIALYGSYRSALLLATAAQAAFNAVARANPYVAAATAIASLVGALYSARNATITVRDTTAEVRDFVIAAWQLTTEEIAQAWNEISQPLANGIRWIASVFGVESEDISDFFGDAMGSVMSYAKLAVNTVIGLFRGMAGATEVVAQSIAENFQNLWTNVGDAAEAAMDFDFSTAREALERDLIDPLEIGVRMAKRLKDEMRQDYVGDFVDSLSSRVAANTLPLQTLDDWMAGLEGSDQQDAPKIKTDPPGNDDDDDSDAAKEAARQAEAFSSSLRRLEDQLYPVEKAQRQYRKEQMLLQTALMKGKISVERYFEAWQRLQEAQRSDENWQDAYGFNPESAEQIDKTSDAARELGLTFTSAFEDAIVEGESFREVLQGIAKDVQRLMIRKSITEPATDALSGALDGFDWGGLFNFGGGASSYGGSGWAGSVVTAASGGYVSGPGTSTSDSIPARLSDGEFVVNAQATSRPGVRPMLEALNSNRAYAKGGLVGGSSSPAPSLGSNVVVNVHTDGDNQVSRQESRRPDGSRQVDLFIRRTVHDMFSGGEMDRPMRRFGARRQSR
ncbi:tape measure protein [Halomonas caseinilytica]|uniref:tape measure protein n=1 Tax=Halomonas caseinilytica TaxID=438744 RepID=UPI0008488BFD|nr:tape measure protein [Halomonas caseinilytica]